MEESPPLFSPKACRSAVTLLWGDSLLMPTLCSIPRDRCRVELEIEEHQFSPYGLLVIGEMVFKTLPSYRFYGPHDTSNE